MSDQTTLVATLGGQPQIVTFTLDLLLAQGETIDQVVIVYPASGLRYRESYRRLAGEFAGDLYVTNPAICVVSQCNLETTPWPISARRTRSKPPEKHSIHSLLI